MLSRAFHQARVGLVSNDATSNLAFMPLQRALEFEAELDQLQKTYSSDMGCIRGIRVAFAIEAIAALSLFGLRYAWHLLR